MKRVGITILNLILIVVGFVIVYANPVSVWSMILGMLLISVAIISFAVLIYFPPTQPKYVKLKVVEEYPTEPKIPSKPKITKKKPKKRKKRSKKKKKSRKKGSKKKSRKRRRR
jgi:hypothetical protein